MKDSDEDSLFQSPRPESDFVFDDAVVGVFEDMVIRSVPDYERVQVLIRDIASSFVIPQTTVYDLGSSLGTTLRLLARSIDDPTIKFVGVDNSESMISRAESLTLKECPGDERIRYELGDISGALALSKSSVVVMCLVLQFVRPLDRRRLLARVRQSLVPGGALLLYEKTVHADSKLNRLFIERYHRFKMDNGYSETEIAQKRVALENVLVPYRHEENVGLLHEAGFRKVTTFSQWLNFVGYLAQP